MENQIRAAVLTAVVCMPTELACLIVKYVIIKPHRFTASGFANIGRCITDDAAKTTELKIEDRNSGRWRTFVSEIPLSIGETEWSFDFPERKLYGADGNAWIGVGVTATDENRNSPYDPYFDLMAGETDWFICILYGASGGPEWYRMHAGQKLKIERTAVAIPTGHRRIWFSADRRTGIVSARFSPAVSTMSSTVDMNTVDIPFGRLRPCVVMAGSASVVFRSGTPLPVADANVGQTVVVKTVGDDA